MDERKTKIDTQNLIKDLSSLIKKYQLKIDSKRFFSVFDLQIEAGAILVRAFRLGLFANDGRLNRIIASFQTNVDSRTDYGMIYRTICENYLVDHKSGFDFAMKQHQHGAEKALIFSLRWFETYLTKIEESAS